MIRDVDAGEETQRDFLSPMAAAEWLGIGRTKMYQLMNDPNGIVSYRIGKRRIVRKADVLSWLCTQRDESGEGGA